MMATTTTTSKLEFLECELQYREALVQALGNPTEWFFKGEVVDAGPGATTQPDPPRCACGHPIRYIFIIHHPVKGQAHIGSSCVQHFQAICPESCDAIRQAIATLQERIKQEEQKAKDAKNQVEIQRLESEWKSKWDQLLKLESEIRQANRHSKYPLPYALWYHLYHPIHKLRRQPPVFKRACDYKKFFKKEIQKISCLLEDPDNFPSSKQKHQGENHACANQN